MTSISTESESKQASTPRLHGWTYGEWQQFLRARVLPVSRTHYRIADAILWFSFNRADDGQPSGRCTATTKTIATRAGLSFNEKQKRCKQVERAMCDLGAMGLCFPVESRYWQKTPQQRGGKKRPVIAILKPGSDEQLAAALISARKFRGIGAAFRLMTHLGLWFGDRTWTWGDPRQMGQAFEGEHARLSEAEIAEFLFWCVQLHRGEPLTFPIRARILRPLLDAPVNPQVIRSKSAQAKPEQELTVSLTASIRSTGPYNTVNGTVLDTVKTNGNSNVSQQIEISTAPSKDSKVSTKEELETKKGTDANASDACACSSESQSLEATPIPTLQEVEMYCNSRRSTVDPEAVWGHCAAVGWMHGNQPIDWKAEVRRGERLGFGLLVKPMSEEAFNERRRLLKQQAAQLHAQGMA